MSRPGSEDAGSDIIRRTPAPTRPVPSRPAPPPGVGPWRGDPNPEGGLTEAVLLMEQLIAAIELRDAADPDTSWWEADAEVRRLEHELSWVLRAATGWRFARYEPPRDGAPSWG